LLAAALTGVSISLGGLLILSGALKLRRPGDAAALLATAAVPGGRRLIAAVAVLELGLGAAAALSPSSALLAVVALAYLGFGVFALQLLRLGGRGQSCGCFGDQRSPVSSVHVAANSAAALLAGLDAATGDPHGLAWLAQQAPGVALGAIVGSAGATAAWFAVFTLLPQAWTSWSPDEAL
jgi:hypothetical protein